MANKKVKKQQSVANNPEDKSVKVATSTPIKPVRPVQPPQLKMVQRPPTFRPRLSRPSIGR